MVHTDGAKKWEERKKSKWEGTPDGERVGGVCSLG
jgi:hypothetical protein